MDLRRIVIAFAILLMYGCAEQAADSSSNTRKEKTTDFLSDSITARDDEDTASTSPPTPPNRFTPPPGFTPPANGGGITPPGGGGGTTAPPVGGGPASPNPIRFDTVNPSQGLFFEDNTMTTGNVTLEDAYRFFPAPIVIATAEITGAQLIQIIEDSLTRVFSTNAFNQWGGWFDGYSGLDISLNLTAADGNRVNTVSLAGTGTAIAATDVLTISGCQRPFELGGTILCSQPGFNNVQAAINPTTGADWTAVDLFVDAIQNSKLSTNTRKRITDSANIQFWPEVEYIQPLYGVQ